jgi:hypothetical protein
MRTFTPASRRSVKSMATLAIAASYDAVFTC